MPSWRSGIRKVLADGGYTGEAFARAVKERLKATMEVVKCGERHAFTVLPRRWIVERAFAWADKCGRLWKNRERKLHSSSQFLLFAFLALILKKR